MIIYGFDLAASEELEERISSQFPEGRINDEKIDELAGKCKFLTLTEINVLEASLRLSLTSGNSSKAIADRMIVSKRTIDFHLSNIYDKLRVSSKTAATLVYYIYKQGYSSDENAQ